MAQTFEQPVTNAINDDSAVIEINSDSDTDDNEHTKQSLHCNDKQQEIQHHPTVLDGYRES